MTHESPSVPTDRDRAEAYFDQNIRPTLGNLPNDGIRFLREQYVRDVRASERALAQLRAWEPQNDHYVAQEDDRG